MINNYRVIRAYFERFSSPNSLTWEQEREIIHILKNNPYDLRKYVRENNINVRDNRYTSLLLADIVPKPVVRDYLKAGLAPEATSVALYSLVDFPDTCAHFLSKGWITEQDLKDPELKERILEKVQYAPQKARLYIENKLITQKDLTTPKFKKMCIEALKEAKGAFIKDDARNYVKAGILTRAEVNKVLGERSPLILPSVNTLNKAALIKAAQPVYDDWDDIEDDALNLAIDISEKMAAKLESNGIEASGELNDQESYVVAAFQEGVFKITIPENIYLMGNEHEYPRPKREGVVFKVGDLVVFLLDKDPEAFDKYSDRSRYTDT